MKQNKLFIASANPGKIKEFSELFPNYEILSLVGKDIEIEETGTTFAENALIKAKAISELFNCTTLSDDSGICANALNGKPGVYSARYANSKNHDDNLIKLIDDLKDFEDKSAYYEACLCLYFPTGEYHFFKGHLEGEIIDEFKGDFGFGYDKIFYLKEYGKTAAEIPSSEKAKISHRALATKKLIESGLL